MLARPGDGLLAQEDDDLTAEGLLRARGFSDDAIEDVFRPLFGAVLLDRSLSADSGYFRFLLEDAGRGGPRRSRATGSG